jgi:gliding motility-associated transport system permease protein
MVFVADMTSLIILLRKELHATFSSPIGYTVAFVFLLVLGYTFSLTLIATKVANLQYIFHQMYVLSILLVPVLTMRAFAEERRMNTLELLLTAPVNEIWIVVAKYLAAIILVVCLYAGSLVYALILDRYGQPDWGPIYSGYMALILHASLIIAIGLLMSSLTENQVVAAALTLGTLLMLWFADSVSPLLPQPYNLIPINLSLIGHFKPMVSGSVFLSDVGYYVTGTLLALFLTVRGLKER